MMTHNRMFLAISVHFPASGKDDEYLECIDDLINFINDKLKEDETILIGADLKVCFVKMHR